MRAAYNSPNSEDPYRRQDAHLTPVAPVEKVAVPVRPSERQQPSDRTVLLRFLAQYRRSGRCDALPQLIEVARLAHQGKLTSPKRARVLFRDLEQIESELPPLVVNLSEWVMRLADKSHNQQILSPEQSFELTRNFGQTIELLDRLMAIARNHPDPPEPGVESGVAPCYTNLLKRTNDLRYGLAYLHEFLRPRRLGRQLARHPHPDLQLVELADATNDLHALAIEIVARLRENIARKVPQLWGSVAD
jgi:hypothetical protein